MSLLIPELAGKFPGYRTSSVGLMIADFPSGLVAIAKAPAIGWAQLVAQCGLVEFSAGSKALKTDAWDPGFNVPPSSDPTDQHTQLSFEIVNSRLAMMAFIGIFFQVGIICAARGDWAEPGLAHPRFRWGRNRGAARQTQMSGPFLRGAPRRSRAAGSAASPASLVEKPERQRRPAAVARP